MSFLKNLFQNLTGSPVSGAKSMINSYLKFYQIYPEFDQRSILYKTLKSRYPEKKKEELEKWIEEYPDIKSLTYFVLQKECGFRVFNESLHEINKEFKKIDD